MCVCEGGGGGRKQKDVTPPGQNGTGCGGEDAFAPAPGEKASRRAPDREKGGNVYWSGFPRMGEVLVGGGTRKQARGGKGKKKGNVAAKPMSVGRRAADLLYSPNCHQTVVVHQQGGRKGGREGRRGRERRVKGEKAQERGRNLLLPNQEKGGEGKRREKKKKKEWPIPYVILVQSKCGREGGGRSTRPAELLAQVERGKKKKKGGGGKDEI